MADPILKRIQEAIQHGQYVMTLHAEEEMVEDEYTIYDVENGILTGSIVDQQKDAQTGEWKYCIRGDAQGQGEIETVVKIGATNKIVILTVYSP